MICDLNIYNVYQHLELSWLLFSLFYVELVFQNNHIFLYGNFSNLWQIDELSGAGERQCHKKDYPGVLVESEVIKEHIPSLE